MSALKPAARASKANRTKVAVIGLGVTGLAAVKNLVEQGFEVEALERSQHIGGLWRYNEDKNLLSVLKTTMSNTSHHSNAYTDFPFPPGTPDFPSADQIADYLESYADHFALRRCFHLGTAVKRVQRSLTGDKWEVSYTRAVPEGAVAGETKVEVGVYDRVYVASGALGASVMPKLPGLEVFEGKQLHTRAYKGVANASDPFKGKRVLVVGMGNTGSDTASSLVGTAESVYLSHHRGGRILPRYMKGKPSDQTATRRIFWLGGWTNSLMPTVMAYLADKALEKIVKRYYRTAISADPSIHIDPAWKLLPAPPFHSSPATISDVLLKHFSTGAIRPLTAVQRVTPSGVVTAEGAFDVDVITFATGSRFDYSFLAGNANPSAPDSPHPHPMLYQSVISINHPDSLAIVGPYKGFSITAMVNADLTAQAVAQIWKGNVVLPDKKAMEGWCERSYAFRQKLTKGQGSGQAGMDAYKLEGWLSKAAGTGMAENLSWGWKGWKFWWGHRKLYRLLMDRINTPHVYRLFEGREGGRKRWDGAEAAIWRLNGEDRVSSS